MTDLGIPTWGQLSITGILFGIVVWTVVAVLSGRLVTARRQDQIDAQHKSELEAERADHKADVDAEMARTRAWQEAWQDGQSLDAQKTAAIKSLTSAAEVFELFIKSLPVPDGKDDA